MKGNRDKIIGRREELGTLRAALASENSEFVAVYGRRRVGKTFLIKNFFEKEKCSFVYVSGMKDGILKEQIRNFADALQQGLYEGFKFATPASWMEAFKLLTEVVNKQESRKKFVLFLDELPWFATKRSRFLQALDYYWNRHWSHNNRFKLIVCGSAASWIISNIIQNKGGLYNRITNQFRLEPFSLKETAEYLREKKVRLNQSQVLEIYLVTGGIPYYLNRIQPNQSAVEAVSTLAFSKNGVLYKDFEILFSSLFDSSETYKEIVTVLSKYRYGLEQEELFRQCKELKKGGTALQKLKDLEEAGFIISFLPYGHKKRGVFYRIIDEYTAFYFKWIEPVKSSAQKLANAKKAWLSKRNSPSWQSWAGYAFENTCYKHVDQIHQALGLDPSAIPATWRHDGKLGEDGAQIDLLFDRQDDAVTLCEIKYTDKPFLVDKSYYQKLKRKVDVYKTVTKTHKEIFLAFIASSGLKKSLYSEEYVSGVVTLDDLFT